MPTAAAMREYQYWVTKNCDRKHGWIVVARLGEMLHHRDTTIDGPDGPVKHEDLPLTQDGLEFVYLVDYADNRLITLVQDKSYFYLIDNTQKAVEIGDEKHVEYQSHIVYRKTLTALVSTMSGSLRKKLKLKPINKIKLKSREQDSLKGILPIDFIGQTHERKVELFRQYAAAHKECLDLSGFYVMDPKVIVDSAKMYQHDQVVLYQNNRFNSFEWLKYFPNIKILSIWYINTLLDEHIDALVEAAPGLNTVEVHYCYQLTGRILIPLSKLNLLEKLVINNEQCDLQKLAYETVITDKEWKDIDNHSLSLVIINSHNLTLDFIDFFLKSFHGVHNFIMNELVLKKLQDNSADGSKDREEPVSFHSVQDTSHGFKRYRDVKVFDLVRNKCGNTFSDAMLSVIKKRSPEKAEAIEQLKNE